MEPRIESVEAVNAGELDKRRDALSASRTLLEMYLYTQGRESNNLGWCLGGGNKYLAVTDEPVSVP